MVFSPGVIIIALLFWEINMLLLGIEGEKLAQ
jgi:hypothetical protein